MSKALRSSPAAVSTPVLAKRSLTRNEDVDDAFSEEGQFRTMLSLLLYLDVFGNG